MLSIDGYIFNILICYKYAKTKFKGTHILCRINHPLFFREKVCCILGTRCILYPLTDINNSLVIGYTLSITEYHNR